MARLQRDHSIRCLAPTATRARVAKSAARRRDRVVRLLGGGPRALPITGREPQIRRHRQRHRAQARTEAAAERDQGLGPAARIAAARGEQEGHAADDADGPALGEEAGDPRVGAIEILTAAIDGREREGQPLSLRHRGSPLEAAEQGALQPLVVPRAQQRALEHRLPDAPVGASTTSSSSTAR
jgi:hypothetical protein